MTEIDLAPGDLSLERQSSTGSHPLHAFMSAGWLEMARGEFLALLTSCTDLTGNSFSAIERFAAVPDGAPRPQSGEPALRIDIAGGAAELRYGVEPSETADLEIACHWLDAWHSAALRHGADLDALNARRLAAGRLAVRGSAGAIASLFGEVHDRIADRTIPPPPALPD